MLYVQPKIKVRGCMRSGTNFLEFLITNFFEIIPVEYEHKNKYGWKHGPFQPFDKCNHIIIFKDIYSWLRSIYLYVRQNRQWHLPNYFPFDKSESFSEFIRSSFHHRQFSNTVIDEEDPICYWNKINRYWLETPLEGKKIFIYYEKLLTDTENQLNELKRKLSFKDCSHNVKYPSGRIDFFGYRYKKISKSPDYYKYNFYKNKEYMNLYSAKDLEYVNLHYDKNLYDAMMQQSIK